MNCSADSNSIQIDFRVGGKYRLDFKNHRVSNWGEFLEIIPDKKIVFSWCQTFGADQKPDTKVTIELFPESGKTRLVLEHVGFKDQDLCEGHRQGWTGGVTDLTSELERGVIRLLRRYDVTIERLYQTITHDESFFGPAKDRLENKKLILRDATCLNFSSREGGGASLEIIKESLLTEDEQTRQRNHFDLVTTRLSEVLK